MKLLNAFSVNMLEASQDLLVRFQPLTAGQAADLAADGVDSAVGHADTAELFTRLLGVPIEARRATVTLGAGDAAVLGQYRGPRLPEGATALPEGATVAWYRVVVSDAHVRWSGETT